MQKVNIAAAFILAHDYDMAIRTLEKDCEDPKAFYWLSLLYRYHDNYAAEHAVVMRALDLNSEDAYMKERKAWLERPDQEKMVPRQPVHLPRDPETTPPQEVIDELCFVTGGDSNFFPLFCETIESIRNTRLYKDVPVYVVDCGLTEEQRTFLLNELKVTAVKDPGWDFDVPETSKTVNGTIEKEPTKEWLKVLTVRPWLSKHFPGHRYYFWIDADAWVHDERGVDAFIQSCRKQGVSVAVHATFDEYKNSIYFVDPILSESQKEFMKEKKSVICASFCVDVQSGFFEEWQKNFADTIATQGYWWNTDEQTFAYTFYQRKLKDLVPHNIHYSLVREGLPVVSTDNDVLYSSTISNTIGIVHMSSGKWFHYFHSQKRDRPIANQQEMQYHLHFYGWGNQREVVFRNNVRPDQLNIPNSTLVSCRFRVLPWQDKPEILRTLRNEAKVTA